MRSIALALVVAAMSILPIKLQAQTTPVQQAATDPAKTDVDKSKQSTIIFFREGHFTGSALKPSIYVDGKEADRLANGKWFSVQTDPGKHQLQSSAKNEPATLIETAPGQTIFVQLVIVPGNWRGGGRLLQVDPAEAQKMIAKLKPLHDKD